MLIFEDSYFEGEEREDFYIEGMMKRAWAAQLEVLKVVEELCRKHGLRYFAEWGTLLGAVRHQGFIPWDDDMDITMPREDYETFLKLAQTELPEEYACLNVYTEEAWNQPLSRVVNSRKIDYSPEHLARFHGCPYAVGVDLFPLDYIARDEEAEALRENLLRMVIYTKKILGQGAQESELEEKLLMLEEYCGVHIDRSQPVLRQLVILIDRLSQLFTAEESDIVAPLHHYVVYKNGKRPKEWYQQMHWVPFETTMISVPDEMHECARAIYGNHYMEPKRKANHEYPFYAKQEKMYQKRLAEQNAHVE